jgi:hypothetical protein
MTGLALYGLRDFDAAMACFRTAVRQDARTEFLAPPAQGRVPLKVRVAHRVTTRSDG